MGPRGVRGPNLEKVRASRVGARRVAGPKFRAFFPLPRPFSLCLSLSGGSSRGSFGGVFEVRDPQMRTFGVLGLSCETLASRKAAPQWALTARSEALTGAALGRRRDLAELNCMRGWPPRSTARERHSPCETLCTWNKERHEAQVSHSGVRGPVATATP